MNLDVSLLADGHSVVQCRLIEHTEDHIPDLLHSEHTWLLESRVAQILLQYLGLLAFKFAELWNLPVFYIIVIAFVS